MKHLLGLHLWHLFKYVELTEAVRQKVEPNIDMMNKVQVGNVDDDVEQLLKTRFVSDFDENYYPKDSLHMYAENEPSIGRNEAALNNLSGTFYTTKADDKISDNCKYPLAMILAAQNQKQTNTGGLAKLFKLNIGEKVMLSVNVGIQCRHAINGQAENVKHIEFVQGSIHKVYVKFSDEQAGLRAMRYLM